MTKRDEASTLEQEAKSLREQIFSMQQRLEILRKLAGRDNSPENKNQLTADIASVNDQVPAFKAEGIFLPQVYQEALSVVEALGAFRSSISEQPNSTWTFADVKHMNDVFSADDTLLDALDGVSKVTLAPSEEDALSADVDLLASEYLPSK